MAKNLKRIKSNDATDGLFWQLITVEYGDTFPPSHSPTPSDRFMALLYKTEFVSSCVYLLQCLV